MIERIIQRVRQPIPLIIWVAISLLLLGCVICFGFLALDLCLSSDRCSPFILTWAHV